MRALDEQRRGVAGRERLEPELVLARHAERRTARDQDSNGARRPEKAHDIGSGVEQMLEVVEEQQELLAPEEAGEVVGCADRLRDLGGQEAGIREAAERNPEHAVAQPSDELRGDLEREPRLPGSAGPGHREQARPVRELGDELVELALPADERARGDGQVRRVERPQGRERIVAELVQTLRADEVLQAMLPEVAERVVFDETSRRLGEDDLATVRGGGDARCPVDVDPDVALVRHLWLSRVDPHAHADGAALERVACLGCGCDRVGGAGEGDEEGVALRVDLDPVSGRRMPPAARGGARRGGPRRRLRAPGAAASSPRRP